MKKYHKQDNLCLLQWDHYKNDRKVVVLANWTYLSLQKQDIRTEHLFFVSVTKVQVITLPARQRSSVDLKMKY